MTSFSISKEEFCEVLNRLRKITDLEKDIHNMVFTTAPEASDMIGVSQSPLFYDTILLLLKRLTFDVDDTISWWCYDKDYGRNKKYNLYYGDELVKLDTAEDLYDYLLIDHDRRKTEDNDG